MADSSQTLINQSEPNVKQEPGPVEPVAIIKQEPKDCNDYDAYHAPLTSPDNKILSKIYDKLRASEKHNRLLEHKINGIESTAKERAQIVDSQKNVMDQWNKKSDDKMEDMSKESREGLKDLKDELKDMKNRLKKYGETVKTTAKHSEANNKMYQTALEQIQGHMNIVAKFISSDSTRTIQKISEMFQISNNETNKNITEHLEKYNESNFNRLKNVCDAMIQFMESKDKDNGMKTLEVQLANIHSKLVEIDKKSNAASNMLDQLPIYQENHRTEILKIQVAFNNLLGYLKQRAVKDENEINRRTNNTDSVLGQITSQLRTIQEKLESQKSPETALETIQNQLVNINELLNETERKCDKSDDNDDEEKVGEKACIFCQYTDHKSEDCHVFPSSWLREAKLVSLGICRRCLAKHCGSPCPQVKIICEICIAKNIKYPCLSNHHPVMCVYKKKEENIGPEMKKESKPNNRYQPY